MAMGMERKEGVRRDRPGDWPWGSERGGVKRKLLVNGVSANVTEHLPHARNLTTCQECNPQNHPS